MIKSLLPVSVKVTIHKILIINFNKANLSLILSNEINLTKMILSYYVQEGGLMVCPLFILIINIPFIILKLNSLEAWMFNIFYQRKIRKLKKLKCLATIE